MFLPNNKGKFAFLRREHPINPMSSTKRMKLYTQLQLLTSRFNLVGRYFMASLQFFVTIGVAITTSAITCPRGGGASFGMRIVVETGAILLALGYFYALKRLEMMHAESVKFLQSLSFAMGNNNKRLKKAKQLAQKRPTLARMPLAMDIGSFDTVQHGSGVDFLQTVFNRTFDFLVLF